MTTPLHFLFLRSDQHTIESIQHVLLDSHLDEVWLRFVQLDEPVWAGAPLLRLELYHLIKGLPILPETLSSELSKGGKISLRISADSERTSIAYEMYQDGETAAHWIGNLTSYSGEEADSGKKKELTLEDRAALFRQDFQKKIGLDFSALVDPAAIDPQSHQVASEGTQVLVRGRFVRLVGGMGRWPEMFRFHDRNNTETEGTGGDRDRVAIVALDLKATDILWRLTPCRQVYQFLRLLEPLKAKVLGPLGHMLPEVIAAIESLPPEAPLAAAADLPLTLYEVIAMSTALVFMVGDSADALDRGFFPMLSLQEGPPAREAIADSAEDIESLGILSAMAEVLPYSIPEGEMMEAVADEELSPLAAWAVHEGTYEGSLFLLDPARLLRLVQAFDFDRLIEQMDAFRRIWFEVNGGGSEEEWLEEHSEEDRQELARFEDTFMELKHVLALAEVNHLTPALFFYGE